MRYLITGGLGFIGSAFVKHLLTQNLTDPIVIIDKFSYCSSPPLDKPNVITYKCNIKNRDFVRHVLNLHAITHIVSFAAETHVDNSFTNSLEFTEENVGATHAFLEECRNYGKLKLFLHISSDEVFGDRKHEDGPAVESSMLAPTTPYSASKAAAEMIVNSYRVSYKMPIMVVRINNVIGPQQYGEKLIPKCMIAIRDNRPFVVQGTGHQRRSFIHVSDVCKALSAVISRGKVGETYNIGSQFEFTVLEVVALISKLSGKKINLEFGPDRPYNDSNYRINCDKLQALGWTQSNNILEQFADTIKWYEDNPYYWPNDPPLSH